jgi:hypothetical protein
MSVTRADVVAALSVHDPAVLRAILDAAEIADRGATTADELAARIADALWWNYATPFGYVSGRVTLDSIVDYVARRLKVEVNGPADAWRRLREMTVSLANSTASHIDTVDPRGVAWADVDDKLKMRLGDSWVPTVLASSGGAASLTAGIAGKIVVRLGATPIGRLLPLLPTVGPIWTGVRKVSGVAAAVGSPLAVGLAVVALDQSLGANHKRLIPLLLGVGALGPSTVSEADVVGDRA